MWRAVSLALALFSSCAPLIHRTFELVAKMYRLFEKIGPYAYPLAQGGVGTEAVQGREEDMDERNALFSRLMNSTMCEKIRHL